MKKTLKLREREVEYTLRVSKRARRMRLAGYCDGAFVVTVPRGINQEIAEGFIQKKAKWVIDKIAYFAALPKGLFHRGSASEYERMKGDAGSFVAGRVEELNKRYQFIPREINIRNQKTRWGSCSRKGNLNFNYRIIFLPKVLADYIIVHELCHLKEFNHSQKFWNLVAQTFPNLQLLRRELKNYDLRLR